MKSKEEVKRLLKTVEQSAVQWFESGGYREKLREIATFFRHMKRYSARNFLLIQAQKPGAQLVASYTTWKKHYGRQVQKGESGIRILAPMFAPKTLIAGEGKKEEETKEPVLIGFVPVSVFDISQTKGEAIPSFMSQPVEGTLDSVWAIPHLINAAQIPVALVEQKATANGVYYPGENRIEVRDDLSPTETVAVLVHEMAHAVLHAKGQTPLCTAEVEAESTALIVCEYLGLDTRKRSAEYLVSHTANRADHSLSLGEGMLRSFERIYEASKTIIERFERSIAREMPDICTSNEEEWER